jgi:hypothetical protein
MANTTDQTTDQISKRRDALADWYHQWMTGLVLALLHRADQKTAANFVFEIFRYQHLHRFLPGIEKLGLSGEPDAIACAKYHYFSNQLGGVKVEYLAESATKAWVRYPPPRWIWDGTAICAVPSEVNLQMMRGWHAHNGVTLNNPRLGFVCTAMTTDGAPGLEGYYREFDHELSEDQRLQFAPDEQCPAIDPAQMPTLDAKSWPADRKAKANLNYAMEYVRNALPILEQLVGADKAVEIGGICARQVGMHNADALATAFEQPLTGKREFAELVSGMFATDGSSASLANNKLVLTDWRLFSLDQASVPTVAIYTEALAGILSVRDRFARIEVQQTEADKGDGSICWSVL